VPHFPITSAPFNGGYEPTNPGTIGPHSLNCAAGNGDCFDCANWASGNHWKLDFGDSATRVSMAVAAGPQFSWFDGFYDVFVTVGD